MKPPYKGYTNESAAPLRQDVCGLILEVEVAPRDWRWVAHVSRFVALHSRVAVSLKAAVAAAIAWTLVHTLPGLASEYPYYAPLGAVIAVSTTVAGSARESLQGLVAILLGAAIAGSIDLALAPNVATVGFAVAAGTLLSGWHKLGSMGEWIPMSALFVLIIGNPNPLDYAIAFGGLITLGAAIGIGINVVFPPLPLTPAEAMVTRLRATLADQLDDLADGLLQEQPPTAADWNQRMRSIDPLTSQMRAMVGHATEALRANFRARRWRGVAERQYKQARSLEQLSFLVEDITTVVVSHEQVDHERVALGSALRPRSAHALQETAEVLRSVDGTDADDDQLRNAKQALQKLIEEVRATSERTGEDLFAAGQLVMTLRSAVAALTPAEE